jgi:hypothetical protein
MSDELGELKLAGERLKAAGKLVSRVAKGVGRTIPDKVKRNQVKHEIGMLRYDIQALNGLIDIKIVNAPRKAWEPEFDDLLVRADELVKKAENLAEEYGKPKPWWRIW